MVRFSLHPEAEAEFDQAVAYYEAKQSGLSLADKVLVAVTRILYPIGGQSLAPKIPSLKRKTSNEAFPQFPGLVCRSTTCLILSIDQEPIVFFLAGG